MNFSRQLMHPVEDRQRFPEEATVSRISSKTVGKQSKISKLEGEEAPVRHPVRRGGLAWKVARPCEYVENP